MARDRVCFASCFDILIWNGIQTQVGAGTPIFDGTEFNLPKRLGAKYH